MQAAVSSVGVEAPLEGVPQVAGALDASDAPAQGGGAPAASGAAAEAAQNATALIAGQEAALEAAQNQPVLFQEAMQGGPPQGDPEAGARMMVSQSMAGSFVDRAGEGASAVLAAASVVPGKALAALGATSQAVAGQAAAQQAALKTGADSARKQVGAQAGRVRGAIATHHGGTDRNLIRDVQDAQGRAKRAHDTAAGGLGRRAEAEKSRIRRSYIAARPPLLGVGDAAADLAAGAAQARADRLLAERDGKSSVLDGPLHDNRLEANAEASVQVGGEYGKSFRQSASEQADALPDSRPEVLGKVDEITGQARTGYASQHAQILTGAMALEAGGVARSLQAATQSRAGLDGQAKQSAQGLDMAEQQHAASLQTQADGAVVALDQSVAAGLTSFATGVAQAAAQLSGAIRNFVATAAGLPTPAPDRLSSALSDANPASALAGMGAQIEGVAPAMAGMLAEGQAASGAALGAATQAANQGFGGAAGAFAKSATGISQQAAVGFRRLGEGNHRSATSVGTQAEAGFTAATEGADQAFAKFGDQVETNFAAGRTQMREGLWNAKTQADLDAAMEKYGQEAADHVQPRWKKVLKWVVTIIVVVAVIVVTVLSAGALGPVGVVLLGAALGAAAGAVQTIANNLIDGEPWSKGVVKAMIVGAVSGAVGGAGGVVLKGVGSIGVKIALEAGVNVIGGVAGEALGSVATGEQVNWTGALMGALVGAGIGAGLGIAGALRGRVGVGGIGEAPPPRPAIEVPPPPPAGRIRSALEGAKILAPRPAPAVPEVNVGAGAGDAAGPTPQPEIAVPPRRPIGFAREDVPVPAEANPTAPRRPIGFDVGEATAEAPAVENAAPPARRPIGFAREDALPETQPAAGDSPRPQRPIGFTANEATPTAATETPTSQPPRPRQLIGFGDRGPAPDPMTAQTPRPRQLIGFGDRGPAPDAPTDSAPSQQAPQPPPPPQPVIIEAPQGPRAGAGMEPAGGRSPLEVRASAQSSGPKPSLAETAPVNTTPEAPAPAPESPAPSPKPSPAQAVEPPAPKPAEAAPASPAREVPPHVTDAQKARLSRLIGRAEESGVPLGDEQLDALGKRVGATRSTGEVDDLLASLEHQLDTAIEVKGGFDASNRPPGGSRTGDPAAELPEGTHASGTTTKPRSQIRTDAEVLADRLTETVGPRPPGHEAHHIIPKGMQGAEEAREILRDAGIGINDVENGVWLPADTEITNVSGTDIHSRVHTQRAIDIMTGMLRTGAQRGREGVLDALRAIRENLTDLRFER